MILTRKCSLITSSLLLVAAACSHLDAANPVGVQSDKLEIRKVLASETKDDSVTVDRRAVLQPAVHPETASNASWWQSAFVKIGSGWRPVEKSHLDADTALLNEYHLQRDAAPKTADGQLKLANWCQSHKLTDQERAHLIQVLVLTQPGTVLAPIYQRMGYCRIGQQWLSPADIQELMAQSQQLEEQLREWMPLMERVVRNWEGDLKQHKHAMDDLDRVQDSTAIPAVLTISFVDETLALQICKRLNKINSFEASQALAALAVLSDWSSVRLSATDCLKGRRVDDFAPGLLGVMRSPLSILRANNDIAEPRLIFREEKDRFVAVDVQYISGGEIALTGNALAKPVMHHMRRTPQLFNGGPNVNRTTETEAISRSLARIDAARLIDDVNQAIQSRTDDENDQTDELNRRSAATLATVTGQKPSPNPQYWWAWWNLYTGILQAPKRVEVIAAKVQLPPQIINMGELRTHHSCLVAGTPVWTDRGFLAIEKIEAGDRVLAKNINTGEVDYKPVVHTTTRPPVGVKKFVVAGVPIVASEGHNFWISGEGWKKTRELKTGQPIHTVMGMSRVESTEPELQPAPVYNLVVADFHTYFVGAAMVLSHDVTPPAPTNVKVPGLAAH